MADIRKLNTVLFADITGYTSLMQKNETHALVLSGHFRDILEETVPKFEGVIVQYFGDACLLTFDSSTKLNVPSHCRLLFQFGRERFNFLASKGKGSTYQNNQQYIVNPDWE